MLKLGKFKSHSGRLLNYKIECDDLSNKDIACLAYIISRKLKFKQVIGIPRGGTRLAKALTKYISPTSKNILIVDDVYTTGNSMEEAKKKLNYKYTRGAVIFFRAKECPSWIRPVFWVDY